MFRHHNPQLTRGNSTRSKINQKPEDQPQDQELFSSSQSVQVDQTLTVNPDLVITFPSSWKENLLQSNPAISNSLNPKSPLFRRKINFPWIYPSPVILKPRHFELFPIFLGTSKQQGSTVVYQTSCYKTLAEQQDSHTLESKYN